MPAILRLPVELLTEIAKLVPQPIRLTLVCQRLNDVVMPLIHHTLTLPLPHRQLGHRPEAGTIARDLGQLLRILIAHSSIGIHVRHLQISFADIPLPSDRHYVEGVDRFSDDIRISAMEAASLHGLSQSIRDQLADGLLGAALFLLLCYLPNLDSLDLIPEFGRHFFHHITSSGMLPCALRSLRSVYIHEHNVWKDIEHEDIFTLFYLPSLRKIRCDIYEPFDYEHDASTSDYQMVLFGGTSKVEDLDIESNHVDTWVLAAMVCSVPGLRSFRYQQGGQAYKPFFGALLGDALQTHVHTLESLEIDVIDVDYGLHTAIGSLRKFSKLMRLRVSLQMLLGSPFAHPRRIGESLPESLISFDVCIDEDWQHTGCGHLTHLIEVDLHHVPYLTRLSLGVRSDAFSKSDLDTTVLKAACDASGITFSIADLPY